jgi:vesicle-associated membrane protein 7
MALEYAAVLRGTTVIAAYGDVASVSERDLVRLLPSHTSRIEQKLAGGRLFSFLNTSALTYAAVSEQSGDSQKPLAFLEELSRRWLPNYGFVSASASGHGLDGVFASHFRGLFEGFAGGKTLQCARELDEAQQILTHSVTKALTRGAELESISSKSENLMATSQEFRTEAGNLKWKMRCQWIKAWAWKVLAVLAVVYLLLSWLCGGWRLRRCL